MKILNVLLLTIFFIASYGQMRMGNYFPWEFALFIISIWEYKLTGWE